MKRVTLLMLAFLAVAYSVSAQVKLVRTPFNRTMVQRNEITIPSVNGYNVYKADFHTHTIYSDGEVTPAMRVEEAWNDGLDIIAITDHMEYRRIERELYRYMKDYISKDLQGEEKAINTNVLNTDPDARGLLVDFNLGYETAKVRGEDLGVMVVRGVEITRGKLGDYNAIFTKDNNTLYDPNLEQTIRNARAQGAIILHNHPQYSKDTKSTMPSHCEDFYAKGLIDGIEVANSYYRWERLYNYCFDGNYIPFSNSDAHNLISIRYPDAGKDYFRNMTLVLAKERTDEAIYEAIKEGRTIAYHANLLIGGYKVLSDLFKACVTAEIVEEGSRQLKVQITNHSSLPFSLRWDGKSEGAVKGLSSVIIKVRKGTKVLALTPTNMFYARGESPVVSFKLQ